MFNNLKKEGLKKEFFKDRDKVINDYFENLDDEEAEAFRTYNYTNGSEVIVDVLNGMAYTRNGFFFSVILTDDEYINSLDEMSLLKALDESLDTPSNETED